MFSQDLGQLIVERPTLINHLLPLEGVSDDRSNLVLVAMINMFYGYLERAQQPQEGYMWVSVKTTYLSSAGIKSRIGSSIDKQPVL